MRNTFFSSITTCPIRLTSLMLVLSSLLGGQVAQASPGEVWDYNPQDSALKLQLQSGVTPKYFLLPNPLRLVVDLPQTPLDEAPMEQRFEGDVSRIRVSEFQPGTTRVVMELAPNSVLQDQQVALEELGGGQWQIRPLLETSATQQPIQTARQTTPKSETPSHSRAIELPVVAANGNVEAETQVQSEIGSEIGSDIASEIQSEASLPAPGLEIPAAASFSNSLHSFQPLPEEGVPRDRPVQAAENLAVDPFIEALPSVPAQGSRARQADPFIIEASPFQAALSESNRSQPSEEPRVPYMVEFGEPLPGMNGDFPAAYMSRDEDANNR